MHSSLIVVKHYIEGSCVLPFRCADKNTKYLTKKPFIMTVEVCMHQNIRQQYKKPRCLPWHGSITYNFVAYKNNNNNICDEWYVILRPGTKQSQKTRYNMNVISTPKTKIWLFLMWLSPIFTVLRWWCTIVHFRTQ